MSNVISGLDEYFEQTHKHTDQGRVTVNMGVTYECASEGTLKLRFKR